MMKVFYIALCLALFAILHRIPMPSGGAPVVEQIQITAGFSRGEGGSSAEAVVLRSINEARSEILLAGYVFTSPSVTAALRIAAERGVKVFVVLDKNEAVEKKNKTRAAITLLKEKGVTVRLNGRYTALHHKFIVTDGQNVETGSFNFTQAAARKNAENAVYFTHAPELAGSFRTEFFRLFNEGEPA